MEAQSINDNLSRWFASTSKSSRMAIILIVMVIGLLLIQTSGVESEKQMCSLFPECELRPDDIGRIQIGLGQAGLDQFAIIDGEIHVPQKLRSEYLKAVGDNGLHPRSLDQSDSSDPSANPFLSRTQQLLAQQSRKKRQICEMITRLPFVAETWMEIDSARGDNVFDADRQSAVISIQAATGENLDHQQVSTIRRIVVGAFAGMSSEDIVVTDLNAGVAHVGRDAKEADKLVTQQVAWEKSAGSRAADIEHRVRAALAEFDGIDFDVILKPIQNASFPLEASFSVPKTTVETSTQNSILRAGTNGTASVTDFVPEKKTVEIDRAKMLSPIHTTNRIFQSEVFVDVRVSKQLVDQVFPPRKSLFGGNSGEKELQANFDKLKSQIVGKIKPVLPVSSFARAGVYPISVSLVQTESSNGNSVNNAQSWLGSHFPSVIVFLLGATMLIIVSRSGRVDDLREDAQLLSIQSAPKPSASVASTVTAEPEVNKQELADLIDQDPEAAASVIKSWIRNAA